MKQLCWLADKHLVQHLVNALPERREQQGYQTHFATFEHRLGVGKGLEAFFTVIVTHTRWANTAKGQIINNDVESGIV